MRETKLCRNLIVSRQSTVNHTSKARRSLDRLKTMMFAHEVGFWILVETDERLTWNKSGHWSELACMKCVRIGSAYFVFRNTKGNITDAHIVKILVFER